MNEDLNATIDRLLDEHRPDRYVATDRDWREPVYLSVAPLVPVQEAQQLHAREVVDRRETQSTRGVNRLLRGIGQSGQWPLDWLDVADRPLSVGPERVRLEEATESDLRTWAVDERRDASQEHVARSQACDGAEWCAAQMEAGGYSTVRAAIEARPEADEGGTAA